MNCGLCLCSIYCYEDSSLNSSSVYSCYGRVSVFIWCVGGSRGSQAAHGETDSHHHIAGK